MNAVRYGAYAGDPEHTQTLANLKTRITTAAAGDSFATSRIANVSGLQAYYRSIGAYDDITPDDGETTTFTPAQPPPVRVCANGTAVPNPGDNRPLVQDCEVLLTVKDTLAGTGTLNWVVTTAVTSWDGVTVSGTPSRVTALVLTSKSLTGTIPPELARLTSLGELKLSGNTLTGCIPLALRAVADNDLDDLSLSYCGDPPPAPENLGVTLTDSTFSITWDAVTNADQYEVQYRTGTESDWIAINPTTADTSTTFTPAGGLICGAFEFRVRARGDGITYIPDWGDPSATAEVAATNLSGLARDCALLLSIKDTLAGTGTLNWGADLAIESWDGVTVSGTPSRVTALDLRSKELTGSIPAELGSLSELQELDLGNNQLTGSIPTELGDLSDLTQFSLDNNQLTGAIPRELGNLANLTQFSLNNNQLTGAIPRRLRILTALTTLKLSDNQLTGSIPSWLGNLTNLTLLHLNNNQLSGMVPVRLADLSLNELKLSGNALTACIPEALRDVAENDFDDLSISYCGRPPAPEGFSASVERLSAPRPTFSYVTSWDVLTGAAKYRLQRRRVTSNSWRTVTETGGTRVSIAASTCTSTVYRVQAYGDGKLYEANWGAAAEATAVCNRAPEFVAESYTFTIFEDAAINDVVDTVAATDDDGDTVMYAISDGNGDGKFAIDSNTGAITVAAVLDYETTASYTLTVEASDGNGGSATASVTVTVTNVPEDLPPAPEGLSAPLADGTFSISWQAVTGASQYEVQYRTGPKEAWLDVPDTNAAGTSATFTPTDGPACGTTYEFQVRSHGDGVTYVADWGTSYAATSVTTDACNQAPAFDGPACGTTYEFQVR